MSKMVSQYQMAHDKPLRCTDEEVFDVISKIDSIKNMFRTEEIDEETGEPTGELVPAVLCKPVDIDETKRVILLCRLKKYNRKVAKRSASDGAGSASEHEEEEVEEADGEDRGEKSEAPKKDVLAIETNLASGDGRPQQGHEKKRKFAISLASLASKPHKREAIVKDGAVRTLLAFCHLHDDVIRQSCAVSFAYLSCEASVRPRMIDEGAISAIIHLIHLQLEKDSSGNLGMNQSMSKYIIKSNCCKALCNLMMEPGSEGRAVKENITSTIINVATVYPDLVEICLKILLNLTNVPDKYLRIEDVSEAIMLFHGMDLRIHEDLIIAAAVMNLSAIRNNQLRLVEDGVLKITDKCLSSKSAEARRFGSDIIRNLTTCHKTRAKLMEFNILKDLLHMAKDSVEEIRTSALKSLYNLSRDYACRLKIVHGNVLSFILKICMEKFPNVDMGRTAAKTVRLLCADPNTAMSLVNEGIVRALMSLLRAEDPIIQQYCAESICCLFVIDGMLDKLVAQGAVSVVVSLSNQSSNRITGEWCSFGLYCLSHCKKTDITTIEEGVLPCLIRLCTNADISPRGKCFCSAALVYITLNTKINSSSSIPMLVHMLKNETEKTTKTNCASALYNLAGSDENCHRMLDVGALMPVVYLTRSDFIQTKVKCAAILSKLSLHEKYYHLFAADDVLRVLLDLSRVDHLLTQRRVVIALSNLSQQLDLRKQLVSLNPIQDIVYLTAKRDENLWRGCVSIICNLSYDKGSESSLVSGGIVPTLLITALINTSLLMTKTIAIKALINLMDDEKLYKKMVTDGVIWALSSLGQIDDVELTHLCATALCRLSCNFSHDMIMSSPAIKMVVKLINQDDVELQRIGGRTLTNMLLKSTDDDFVFREHAVQKMSKLARCKDEEVTEMCIICLCLASQSNSCRTTIVSSGMLKLMDAGNIFKSSRVSYAYLTMFGNIANNPEMRTALLDEKSISRFEQICNSGDPNLDLAVAKAIYYITCAPENIDKLAQQNLFPILWTIWKAPYEKSHDLLHHIIAILFNMCLHENVQNKLVSQGCVNLLSDLWPRARDDIKLCRFIISAISHLCCGYVNSNKLVQDGVTPILTFITSYKTKSKYSNYYFDTDMYIRASIAMRNMLCVIPNQQAMINEGALQCLLDMNQMAIKFGPENTQGKFIIKNISSGLRALTFNAGLRDMVVASGAIKIILTDINEEMSAENSSIQLNLLKELEAESWLNGSRGNNREGRAPPIAPAPCYTDLLRSTMNVQLDVEIRHAELKKYHVQIQLDEVDDNCDNDVTEEERRTHSEKNQGPLVEHGINDLASFDEPDEKADLFQNPRVTCQVENGLCDRILEASKVTNKKFKSLDEDGNSIMSNDNPDDGSIPNLPPIIKNNKLKSQLSASFDNSLDSMDERDNSMDFLQQPASAGRKTRKPNPDKQFAKLVKLIKHSNTLTPNIRESLTRSFSPEERAKYPQNIYDRFKFEEKVVKKQTLAIKVSPVIDDVVGKWTDFFNPVNTKKK